MAGLAFTVEVSVMKRESILQESPHKMKQILPMFILHNAISKAILETAIAMQEYQISQITKE